MRMNALGGARPTDPHIRFSGKRPGLLSAALLATAMAVGGAGCSTQQAKPDKVETAAKESVAKPEVADKAAPLTKEQIAELRRSLQTTETNFLARAKKRGEAVHRLVDYLNVKVAEVSKQDARRIDPKVKATLSELGKTFALRQQALAEAKVTNEAVWGTESLPFTAPQKVALTAYLRDVSFGGAEQVNQLFSAKDTDPASVKALLDNDLRRMDLSSDAISWRVATLAVTFKLRDDLKSFDEKAPQQPYESLIGRENLRQVMAMLLEQK